MADVYQNLYNPDVLSCLANLSNDEVFTPPEVANRMLDLLPQELFRSPDTTFLDPACKSGVFLREIAKRLLVGLENEIPDLQHRVDHIFHKQLYGIAITELTSLLSRRSVYCSKYPNSKYSITHFDDASGNIEYKRIQQIAKQGEYDEFDLNVFFSAKGKGRDCRFVYEDYVQKWLDLIRGSYLETTVDELKLGAKKPALPFADSRLLNVLQHTLWFLPNVASCYAMANLLADRKNTFYHDYQINVCAGTEAGIGAAALEPVQRSMGDPLETKTITLSCGKLTTGVTVKPWTGIFMLRNLSSPETYFQAAFRVQSPWEVTTDKGQKEIIKKECYVFDFALNRALRQIWYIDDTDIKYFKIFSLYCMEYDPSTNFFLKPNPKMCEFGDTAVIIADYNEFIERFGKALFKKYDSVVSMMDRVKFYNFRETRETNPLFEKHEKYSYQNELRMAFCELRENKFAMGINSDTSKEIVEDPIR